ncbi:MAG: hypothetical protein KKF46_04320 [Nanoarchaeota archaeon]|nr:hypothetical protein [Nanoarchaeota archaeon]MBU1321561.1 hypothetical protein [Nanoarchaeota archaeon]MBU1597095.1 hypothetical protein [Nanoarchaeota archaeon]MBU2441876.1 hypothetical protein [Nanoarchaeota archaeon]
MKACNGVTDYYLNEAVEISRLEPVVIEVEEADGRISSHLILFELICKINLTEEEIVVNGEVQETVFQTQSREFEG